MMYLVLLSILVLPVYSDVYLHNPRGSNNRCDRRTNDRRNANRLFDSQNNAAGGYAAPCNRPEDADSPDNITCFQMNYYEDTIIPIRWTSQHACGENNDCQYILQYACEDTLGIGVRDGHPQNALGDTCTDTIPEVDEEELDNPLRYGRHESYDYYQQCKSRTRNHGLFIADQRLRGHSAIYTRQNPNGNRYGFECPEERDYYPYWSHTPWIDIAVLTTNSESCNYYYNNSQCYSSKFYCEDNNDDRLSDINYDECIERDGLWFEYQPWGQQQVEQNLGIQDLGIEQCNLDCRVAPTSIINRLGIENGSAYHQEYNWTLPRVSHDLHNCVLRLRYNISTKDTPWSLNSSYNGDMSPVRNNPIVNISTEQMNVPLRLAVDTSQFGRVFEDRTWTFNILKRPNQLQNKNIYNFNVQGKRGNIAQVRNCIEYDFVPNRLNISTGDYIHFQWVGSDFNPHNNAGEGRAGTDRSNLVELADFKSSYPREHMPNSFFTNYNVKYNLASLGQPINDEQMCFSQDELWEKRNDENNLRNCALLNRADPYFNIYPVRMNNTGRFGMVCTRNNNFSNRGQKAIINVYRGTEISGTDIVDLSASQDDGVSKINIFPIVATCIVIVIIFVGIALWARQYSNKELKHKWNCIRRSLSNQI